MAQVFSSRIGLQLALVLSALPLGGCAVLFGTVRPVEQNATEVHGIPASADSRKLEVPPPGAPWVSAPSAPADAGGADQSWQNPATGSTLSFTSGCREVSTDPARNAAELEKLASAMTGGLSRVTARRRREAMLDDSPGLESTVEGQIEGRKVVIRTLVSRKDRCVYDVTLVSLKQHLAESSTSFDHWISRIRLP
jgi:hypothetical protein